MILTPRSTFIPVNVKFPNLGICTPLPFFNYLHMYWPSASQMVSDAFSFSWLVALRVSPLSLKDLNYVFPKPALLVVGSPLKAALSVSALYTRDD